jgi:zinc resistance-associated protein
LKQPHRIQEDLMSRISIATLAAAGLAVLFLAGAPQAYAQPAPAMGGGQQVSESDWKAYTDWRIDVVKLALALTPEQEKYWPAVEQAIRDRANMRHQRLAKLASRLEGQHEYDPISLLRARADGLTQRGAALKKLVDAWQPLHASLDDRQKLRLRFLAVYVLREMRDAVQSRLMQYEEEEAYEE